jgi:hypothetical protein
MTAQEGDRVLKALTGEEEAEEEEEEETKKITRRAMASLRPYCGKPKFHTSFECSM